MIRFLQKRPAFRSIRARVLLLIGLLMVAVLVTAYYRAYDRRSTDLNHALVDLQERTDRLVQQQTEAIRHAEEFLSLLVHAVELERLAQAPDCPRKLSHFLRSGAHFANVFLLDLEGRVICNPVSVVDGTMDFSDRGYFQQALKTPTPVMGDATQGRLSGKWLFPFAQRYTDEHGRVKGVAVIGLDMAWITREFERIVGHGPARLGLVGQDGVVLARYPEPEQWVGRNIREYQAFQRMLEQNGMGTLKEVTHDGEERIFAFAPFVQTPAGAVYLWFNVPLDSVTAPANRQFVTALWVASVLMLFISGLAIWGSNALVVRPLQAIMRAAQELAAGNPLVRTGLPHGDDEIGRLALTFDEMAHRLTQFDPLTGMLNEKSFSHVIDAWIARLDTARAGFALIRISVENSQYVEAHFGLELGHEFVRCVGQRILERQDKSEHGARLEEGNFAVLLDAGTDMQQASTWAQGLEQAITSTAFEVQGLQVYPEVRMGISFFPMDGRNAAELLQHASVALSHARLNPEARVQFFEQGMNDLMRRRIQLTNLLRIAIEHDRLELHYQPQIDLGTRQVTGFEALVRWRHPELGFISPAEFIPLAEASGLIQPLGAWVLRRAVLQRQQWRTRGLIQDHVPMAINISPIQLLSGRIDEALVQLLAETGLPPSCVELELTEGHLLSKVEQVCSQLQRFSQLGVQVSIDDFGTGYSSLAYLKQYAIDKLKIDKSFIDDVTRDTDNQAIVRATVAMAHALGLKVVAEGVETEAQAAYLLELGCNQMQGFHYCRPLPAADIERLLRFHA